MTDKQKRVAELFELVQLEEGLGTINMHLPVRPVEARFLEDLMTIFCRLDVEHQERAVSALNNVLADQIAEYSGSKSKAI